MFFKTTLESNSSFEIEQIGEREQSAESKSPFSSRNDSFLGVVRISGW